jgi:1,4-dihydroxy-2-naphthoate octaprenyltransferase
LHFKTAPISIPSYFFSLFTAIAFHLGANCLNDYFDFINNVDSPLAPAVLCRSHLVFTHLLEPKELFYLGVILLAIAVSFGVLFTILISPWMEVFLVLGLFLLFFIPPSSLVKIYQIG